MNPVQDLSPAIGSAIRELGLEPLRRGRRGLPAGAARIGLLDPEMDHAIQVAGRAGGDPAELVAALERLARFGRVPVFLVVGDDLPVTTAIHDWADRHDVSLFRSPHSTEMILATFARLLDATTGAPPTVHGVLLAVMNIGVLLTGESGIGKSEVALDLVTRGHRLVADDAVHVERRDAGQLVGWCPPALRDHMEVRGLGILNLRDMFGGAAISDRRTIDLIVRLEPFGRHPDHRLDRLRPSIARHEILGVELPEVLMFVAPGRNLAVLIEAAVRSHILRLEGRDPVDDFVKRQQAIIDSRATG
jgi:HPr kinase/phosphorylase